MLSWWLTLSMLVSASAGPCQVGAYRLADATTIDIAPAPGNTLRWRRFDGVTGALAPSVGGKWISTLGWTGRPDGHVVTLGDCAGGGIAFDGVPGQRIDLAVQDTTFAGAGETRLAGRLLLPPGDTPVPIVVLVHGSELDSALIWDWMQRLLPAEGVGAFVYDKRGTGRSQGEYTQDFEILAADAVAASIEARRLAGARAGRIGYRGASQGGWVAPMAANRAQVDFVVVVFGLAVSPLQQDHEAVAFQMRAKGYGDDVIAQAWEVSDAAAVVVSSNFSEGLEAFEAARAKYRDKAWYPDLQGNVTQFLLPLTKSELHGMTHIPFPMAKEEIRERGQIYIVGTPWHYDPLPLLRQLRVPQLWLLGGEDRDAPAANTLRRLHALAEAGAPITTKLFENAEHGMTEVAMNADGERESVRYPAGYLRMIVDFAHDSRLMRNGDNAEVAK